MQIQNPTIRATVADFISDILTNPTLSLNLRKKMIHHLLWSATCDSDGGETVDDIKYRKIYWTPEAVEQFNTNGNNRDLRHEHIVPQKIVKLMLNNITNSTSHSVLEVINTYHFAAVVTLNQNRKLNRENMPDDNYVNNPTDENILARYVDETISLSTVLFEGGGIQIDQQKLTYDNLNNPIVNNLV
jgi:hypothetical protein